MSLIPSFKIGILNAWIFMSVFILQMLVVMCADKIIREKSHVPMEAKNTSFEKRIGGILNMIWLLALGYSVFLPLMPDTVWFIAGLVVFIFGLFILILATFDFLTTPAEQVMKKGVYRLSRHPMYLSTFFICLGSGLAAASWLFVILSIIIALCFHQEALIEERYCLEKYGTTYQDYLNRVPRWIGIPNKMGQD